MSIETLAITGIIGGFLAYQYLRPRPNAVVLEKVGENYALSKAFHNEHYLQYRRHTFPIPSTYEYWVMLWRGFSLRPKWIRFFYIENSMLSRISEGQTEPAITPEILTQFVRSQTLTQLLRGLTIPKMTLIMYLIMGLIAGLLAGFVLAGWIH